MNSPLEQAYLERDISLAASLANNLEELGQQAVPLLERAFQTSASCLYRCSSQGEIEQIHGTLGELKEYGAEFYSGDPIQAAMRRVNPWLSHSSRFPEWKEYIRLPVYQFSLRQGMDDYMILRLSETPHDAPGMVGIMLARSRRQAPFTRREERLASRLLPTLESAVRRLARTQHQLSLLETVVEWEGLPKLALDRRGNLLWASQRAEKILALRQGGKLRIPGPLTEGARRLGELLGKCHERHVPPSSVRIPRLAGEPVRAELHLVRNASGNYFILVELDQPDVSPQLGELAERFRLTEAEAEVLAMIAQGMKNREIARRRFVSQETVHTHVCRIFSKLEVHSRAQAALMARGAMPKKSKL